MIFRLLRALCAATIVAATSGLVVFAQKPLLSCPAEASGWFLVDRDAWWENTVAGFELEGIEVYDAVGNFTAQFEDFAVAFGFESAAVLEEFVRFEQWSEFDKNENDLVCMKVLPRTPGIPAFFFGGIDDRASTKRGQSGG